LLNFNCWGLKINDFEEVVFEKRGTEDVFHSDYLMPIGEKLVVILVAENSKAKDGFNTISLIVNGDLVMKKRDLRS
jgi:hypothetical protein